VTSSNPGELPIFRGHYMQESRLSIIEQMRIAELEWRSIPMNRDYEKFKNTLDLPRNILYAFEGKYDAYPTKVVLYIGKMEAEKGTRPRDSAYARFLLLPRDVLLLWRYDISMDNSPQRRRMAHSKQRDSNRCFGTNPNSCHKTRPQLPRRRLLATI